jgi:hypothetical protein
MSGESGGGRGPHRRFRGSRRNCGGRKQNNKENNSQGFDGRVPELKGFNFGLTEERTPEQYVRTTKKVITYVASKFTSLISDLPVVEGLQALSLDDPQPPTDPDPADPMEDFVAATREQSAGVPKLSCRPLQSRLWTVQRRNTRQVMSHPDFDACNQNGIALLLIVKALTRTLEEQLYLPDATSTVFRDFYDIKQRESEGSQA